MSADYNSVVGPLFALHASFAVSLFVLLVIERFVNAASVLVARLLLGGDRFNVSDIKTFASIQMLGAGASLVTSTASAVASALLSSIPALLAYVFWALAATILFSTLYVVQEYYPSILVNAVDYWNGSIGGYIYSAVFVPLRILNILFTAISPAYNFSTWVVSQFLSQSLLPATIKNSSSLVDFALATSSLFKHLFEVIIVVALFF
jgi:hypothetical protein